MSDSKYVLVERDDLADAVERLEGATRLRAALSADQTEDVARTIGSALSGGSSDGETLLTDQDTKHAARAVLGVESP